MSVVRLNINILAERRVIEWYFHGYVTKPLLVTLDVACIPWTEKDP